jgi:hypothetical protein
MMTASEFFEEQQSRARQINPEHIIYLLDQPEHLITMLLTISDGFRGLAGYCLSIKEQIQSR